MTFEELDIATQEWAEDKGIFVKSDAFKQFQKTLEEVDELTYEMSHLEHGELEVMDSLKTELGDVIVTLILTSRFLDTSIPECLEIAYNKISTRKGKMVNGLFERDRDLPE